MPTRPTRKISQYTVNPWVLITTVRAGHKWMDTNSRLRLARITIPVDYCTAGLPMDEQYDYIRAITPAPVF